MTFDQWAKGQMLLDDEIGLSYARRAWEAATDRAAGKVEQALYGRPCSDPGTVACRVRTCLDIHAAIRSQDG